MELASYCFCMICCVSLYIQQFIPAQLVNFQFNLHFIFTINFFFATCVYH